MTRGRRTSTRSRRSARWTARARTPEQTHIALFWQSAGGPALLWNAVARNLVEDPNYAVDLGDSALLFAKLNLSGADAGINCWNDKYYWDFWRPWQAIHEADQGRQSRDRARRVVDGAHHRAVSRASVGAPLPRRRTPARAADVLRHGQDPVRRDEQASLPRVRRATSTGSRSPSRRSSEARIWAGLHYRTADVQATEPRQEGRPVHGEALLPAAPLT